MMGSLLPPGVVVVEAEPEMWEAPLLPEEARLVARALPRRRREFSAGRACARLGLSRLGFPAAPLLAGPDRAPIWPQGAVGSITHCAGYCAAAVARESDLRGLGIDAEVNQPLPEGVAELVCTASEQAWAAAAPGNEVNWPTLIFSAKESVYKAWYTITRQWLGYLDAELSVDCGSAAFEARLLVPAPAALGSAFQCFRGSFAANPAHIFTAVSLSAA
jgi:enterobactin synthetase component D / holo-[acyl-carrier protein] synthase